MAKSLIGFLTWSDVLAHVKSGKKVYYHAPMDRSARVVVATVRGNGKMVRVDPLTNQVDKFWADNGHLDRFKKEA